MSDITPTLPSLADRVRPIAIEGAVVGVHFLGSVPVFVLGEEHLLFAPRDAEPRRVAIHAGGILASTSDGKTILTGGDDGKLIATDSMAIARSSRPTTRNAGSTRSRSGRMAGREERIPAARYAAVARS